jgi:hypothetical protein
MRPSKYLYAFGKAPLPEFSDFKFVNWETEIYPVFKGKTCIDEIEFFVDLIVNTQSKYLLDLAVGGGIELGGILTRLNELKYKLAQCDANEMDEAFIKQARTFFRQHSLAITIHKADWSALPYALPSYNCKFDFAYLTGNSLSYLGGDSIKLTRKIQQDVLTRFSFLIKNNAHLFVDSRNFDFILSLEGLSKEDIFEKFCFEKVVYYHGFQREITVFPAHISPNLVILHYYYKQEKKWSSMSYFPILQTEMMEMLSDKYLIEKVYHDFSSEETFKSQFIQYLVRKK